MKLHKLTLGILTALATFALSVGVFTGIQFALFILSPLVAKPEIALRTVPKPEPDSGNETPKFTELEADGLEKGAGTQSDFESKRLMNRTGRYYLESKSGTSKFGDVDFLEIQAFNFGHDSDGDLTKRPIAPLGFLQAKQKMKFASIAIGGDEIAFQTMEVDGVSYSFRGELRNKTILRNRPQHAGIKGPADKVY